jgi:hypothetical protein
MFDAPAATTTMGDAHMSDETELTYVAGNQAIIYWQTKDAYGRLTDATTTVLTVTKPDNSTSTPSVVHDDTGCYHAVVTTDATGLSSTVTSVEWKCVAVSTGLVTVGSHSITVVAS